MSYIGCIVVGLVAGFVSSLLGIGGGVIIVPMLLMLFPFDMRTAIGTSLACIVPLALSGALQHGVKGNVMLKVVLIAVPFGLMGAYFGVKASNALSVGVLRSLFGILMVLIGLQLLLTPRGWAGVSKASGDRSAQEAAVVAQPPGPDADDSS